MKKNNILKKNEDFNRIIQNLSAYKFRNYFIYLETIDKEEYHFGISVSKKNGSAVVRNKYKRILKNIIDKKAYKNGFNCIIIIKKSAIGKKYSELEEELYSAFYKLKIIKE